MAFGLGPHKAFVRSHDHETQISDNLHRSGQNIIRTNELHISAFMEGTRDPSKIHASTLCLAQWTDEVKRFELVL